MIVAVVPVVAGFEQFAELDRLVGLVMVHGPQVGAGQAERQREGQRRQDHAAEDGPVHLAGVPKTSIST